MGRRRLFSWLTAGSGWTEGCVRDGDGDDGDDDDDDGDDGYDDDDDEDHGDDADNHRCGSEFPLDDGLPSECDGSSFFPCCLK